METKSGVHDSSRESGQGVVWGGGNLMQLVMPNVGNPIRIPRRPPTLSERV